jgi:hypothetical protein
MRGQDTVKFVVIGDVSLVSAQGGKQVYNQVADMSPQSTHCRHNTARVVSHGCFMLFIESHGQVPG